MAQVVGANQVRLNDGKVVSAQQGGWYDGQQFWNGSLSNPGQIHQQSNQQGAGQYVSEEVVRQTNPNNVAYLRQQNPAAAPSSNAIYDEKYGSGNGFSAPEAFNLQSVYDKAFSDPAIQAAQKEADDKLAIIEQRKKELADAEALINDNPFFGEATRVGKVNKLREKAARDMENIQTEYQNALNKVQTLKGDAETKVNIALKQYDINNQAYQQNLQRLNALISTGAILNASPGDLAGIAASTGISTSMLQGVIDSAKREQVAPQLITSTDNNGNVSIVAVDKYTGNIISQQTIGGIGKAKTGGGGSGITATFRETADSASGKNVNGTYWGVFPQLVAQYAPYMSLQSIYKEYANTGIGKKYGAPKEDAKQIKELYNYARSGTVPKDSNKSKLP